MTTVIETIATPDGPFSLLADEDGAVLASGWTADLDALLARLPLAQRDLDVLRGRTSAAEAALAYYEGEIAAIDDVAVRQSGTELQLTGWRALRDIAPGRPLTYTELAATIGRPSAVRAAASICARNAPALFVPCHRVLRAGGALGGFAWGLDVKRSLLAREAVSAA